jgi:mRNA-degrading endonuclease toxin of MazEF toxin-antitoxin module
MSRLVPKRGFIYQLTESASIRLKVPKVDRPWVVIQNDSLRNPFGTLACYTTSVVNSNGQKKPQGPADVLVKPTWKNALFGDSYVVCGHIYTVRPDEFRGDDCVGWLIRDEMRMIGFALRKALSL